MKFDLECKFCVYLIELLEGLLPKEKTEVTFEKLRYNCKQYVLAKTCNTPYELKYQETSGTVANMHAMHTVVIPNCMLIVDI